MSLTYLYFVFVIFLNDCKFIIGQNCSTVDTKLNAFEEEILKRHNDVRAKHEDTYPLCWSKKLAQDAQLWADSLAEKGGTIKASNYVVDLASSGPTSSYSDSIIRYGENIYRGSLYVESSVVPTDAARSSVNSWYNQEHMYSYNFDTAGISDKTKEFTQLIWRSTDKIGCGYSEREYDFFIVVCEYTPTGNEGSRSDYNHNVKEKITCDAPQFVNYGSATRTGPFVLNSKVAIQCNTGFKLKGQREGQCTERGWDFGLETPTCTGCIVPEIGYGFSEPTVGSVLEDTGYVTYDCEAGFSLDSARRVIACSGNELGHPVPRCRKEKHCLRPIIRHGWASTPGDDYYEINEVWGHNVPEGVNISIACKDGYELVGNRSAVCLGETFGSVGTCNQSEAMEISSSGVPYLLSILVLLSFTFTLS